MSRPFSSADRRGFTPLRIVESTDDLPPISIYPSTGYESGPKKTLLYLHRAAAVLHWAQMIASIILAALISNKLWVDGFPVVWWIPVFFGISGLAETYASFNSVMTARLRRGYCIERWVEYFFSAGVMLVAIAQLSFEHNVAVYEAGIMLPNLMVMVIGAFVEIDWNGRLFGLGCVIGSVPWIFITRNIARGSPPAFVWGIYVSLLCLFGCFPLISYITRERDSYHDADKYYTIASLLSKTALGWQVFGGALQGDRID